MFPNVPDALPLPPRPNLERYRKLAKELVKACRSDDPSAVRAWADAWIESLARLGGLEGRPGRRAAEVEGFARRRLSGERTCALADAQFVIARSHGFESWPKLVRHIEAVTRDDSRTARFESAVDAIVRGDAPALRRLLREDPELVRARSEREHRATLLHYVAANGVENYRQKTPPNIVEIAQMLLDAGAAVDATAPMYGGECTALGLAATSIHPEKAGVQEALLALLLDRGAAIDRPVAGRQHPIVIACLANGRPKAAAFLADRGAALDLVGAAALGRLDLVRAFLERGDATPNERLRAFLFACEYGGPASAGMLLETGADLGAHSGDGQTALHRAVIGGQLETVRFLLSLNAPLEAKNAYGGTVLGQALWSAAHGGDPATYAAIIETLLAAGAQLPRKHVPVNEPIDALLRRHGSEPEPAWTWEEE